MSKWEYRIERVRNFDEHKQVETDLLNNLGVMGWELVSVVERTFMGFDAKYRQDTTDYIFKRRIDENI
jgi:hypothetical protein